jgi:hypothetical protein
VNRPQAEGENRSQEQKYDAKHVHSAIPRIAVIFHVIRKLALKIGTHTALVSVLAYGNASKPTIIKIRR